MMFPLVTADLLKRLDDSSEEVRSVALQALSLWLSGLTEEYNPEWCAAHLQLLFQQLLLHLDDPENRVQEQVLGEARFCFYQPVKTSNVWGGGLLTIDD